jgi:recombinase-like zinc beta ribbon protein
VGQHGGLAPFAFVQGAGHASILRGVVRCGHCGFRMSIINSPKYGPYFRCQTGTGRPGLQDRCAVRGMQIMTHKLDAAVWEQAASVLLQPAIITEAIERMRAAPAPGADNLASIDARLAEIDRQIGIIHKQVLKVDDDDARDRWAAEEKRLWNERRAVEAERIQSAHDVEGWRILKYDMEAIVTEIMGGGKNPDAYTVEERRKMLLTLGVAVLVYHNGHTPRARMVLRLPLSRPLAIDVQTEPGENGAAPGLNGAYYVDSIRDLVTV